MPKLQFLFPVKLGRVPKTESENHQHTRHIGLSPTVSLISIGGFLKIRKTKRRLSIGAIVKFSFFRPWKNWGGSCPNEDLPIKLAPTSHIYVTIFLIFLNPSRRMALEKKPIGPILTFSFCPLKNGEGSQKLRPAYKTYTYTTHIHNSFPCLRWRISEIMLLKVNKKVVLSQRWPRDAPYIWVPWKFLNVHRTFEMRSLSSSWYNSDWNFGWGLWTLI